MPNVFEHALRVLFFDKCKCYFRVISVQTIFPSIILNSKNWSKLFKFKNLLIHQYAVNPVQDGPIRNCSWKGGFEFLKTVLINMVTIFIMSAKMATLGFLEIKVFWNKGFDVIVSVHDVTNKNLSRNSKYIVDVQSFSRFNTIPLHHKGNGTRLLSPEIESTICLKSCRTI